MINYGDVHFLPAENEHVSFLVKCGNERGLSAQRASKRKTCVSEQQEHIKSTGNRPDYFLFVVIAGGAKRGVCELWDLDWVHRSCKLGLYWEDHEANSKAHGKKALNAILSYAFQSLDLHRVEVDLLLDDHISSTMYKEYGFKQEVRKRSHYFSEGSYRTVLELGLLQHEFSVQP